MKAKLKTRISRVLSLLLAVNLVLSLVITADFLYPGSGDKAYAASESSVMGTDSYSTGIAGGCTLTAGKTYKFGGYEWVCAETSGNLAVLQSTGVTSGYWPGYTMSKFGNNSYYASSIDGQDISDYDQKTKDLYAAIKAAEYTSASYGKGLFLVSNAKCNQTSSGNQGSGNYWAAHKTAAGKYSSFGASYSYSWLGTVGDSSSAWVVYSDGNVYVNSYQYNSCVVAPAFNLDQSKARLSGDELTVATFSDSTEINATQSISSITEGQSVDLSQIITGVTYVGGDNNGKSAGYKISANAGSISGTTWTAPTGINTDQTVTLTITSTGKTFTTAKTVTVTPRAAGSISVEKKSDFPEAVTVGDSVDLSKYITVTGLDSGSEKDGEITSYSLSSDIGSCSGTTFTPGKVTTTKTATITVIPSGNVGSVNYTSKTASITIKVKPDTTGWTDRDELEPADNKGFHTYEDKNTGITWKYKYNDNGDILYLFTEDDVASIISSGHVLLVPSTINGVPVVGIGGGQKDGDIIPFIPTDGDKANNSWTSIHIPSSVKVINDGAFLENGASADIVIPGTVQKIGVYAFKASKIKSVVFNDVTSLDLNSESFAEIPCLTSVAIRGNGATIRQRAFSGDTGITEIDIPNGTRFKGETDQNDSYAFQGTTGLKTIKIDTETVYSNIFSGNKNLEKVIFGENVTRVKYDWSGTAASNAATLDGTAARSTYALNEDTIFEMDKSTGGSPFGYANALTVVGKNRDLNGDTNAYVNTTDPVTAKIAYLATYYKTNSEVNGYAKGTGNSITITAEDNPANNDAVTSTIKSSQTGIEAYYNGIILTGKTLEKDKMSVYKMFGTLQKGSYKPDGFYALRTTDADVLLAEDNTNEKNSSGDYVTTYTDDVIAGFEAKDSITVTADDLAAGTVDVKVIVLQKDADGRVLVDHSNGHVKAYTFTTAIPVKAYTAENDFLENYGSYQAVIDAIDSLKKDISTWEKEVAELTGLSQSEVKDKEKVKETLEKTQKQLNDYVAMYNALVEQLNELTSSTDTDDTGYFGKVVVNDPATGKDYANDVVYINGKEFAYQKTGEQLDGKDLYTSTGDVDGDGKSETVKYYVDKDGVHIIQIDGKTLDEEVVYKEDIRALQRRLAAQLTSMRAQLGEYATIIPNFKDLLNIVETNFDSLSGKEQLELVYSYVQQNVADLTAKNAELDDINAALDNLFEALQNATGNISKLKDGETGSGETAADKINSITSMVTTLSSNYDANNAYLRNCIIEIDRAFGYGDYIKYNDKYVFVIYQTESFVYYIKTDAGRQYLYYNGDGTFTEAQGDEASSLAAANDATEGDKFMVLTDTTNGWDPYVANPLVTYKKAMTSFINGFNSFDEKSGDLLAAVNAINGKKPGDEGYLSIPDDASAAEKTSTAAAALETVKGKLNSLELTRSLYAENLAKIAQALDGYLNMSEGSAADMTEEELAALVQKAADTKAKLDGLQGDMDDVNAALANLWATLDSAFSNMGLESGISTEDKGRGEESTADKINSISSMVAVITDSYNSLKAQYGDLEQDYQKVINYVYGEDEKTVDQVTADQIVSQLEANKQSAISAAVEAALADSDNFNTYSTALQKKIAGTIDKILDGGEADTTDLQPELAAALAEVKTMQTELAAMSSGSSAYAEFLQTLRTALSLEDTADAATILESIQGLKNQVASLTADLTEANTTIGKIQSKLATDKTGDDLVALVGKGDGDTDAAYKNGYNAGYAAGKKDAENSSNTSTGSGTSSADYQNGYNAGYVAGTKANAGTSTGSSETAQILSLTKENASLTSDNKELTNTVETLQDGIDDLYDSVTSTAASTASLKGASAASYVSKLSKVKDLYNELSKDASAAVTENSALSSSNEKLKKANKTLTTTAANLKTTNKSLKQKNEKLTTQNKALTEKNKTLTSKNSSLTSENNSLRSSNSSLKTQISSRTSSQTVSTPVASSSENNTAQKQVTNQKKSSSSNSTGNESEKKTDKKEKDDEDVKQDTEENKTDDTENSSMPFSINSVSAPTESSEMIQQGQENSSIIDSSENDELTADLPNGETPTDDSENEPSGSLKTVFIVISLFALLGAGFLVIVLKRKQNRR